MENPEFVKTVKKTRVLVNKVLQEIPEARKSCVSSEVSDVGYNFLCFDSGLHGDIGYGNCWKTVAFHAGLIA